MKIPHLAALVAGALLLAGCGSTSPLSDGGKPPDAAAAPLQAGLVAAPPAEAGDLVYLPVERLAALSTHVVRGVVMGTSVGWDKAHTSIVTTVDFNVTETLRGTPLEGPIQFTQLGGEADGVAMSYGGRPVFTTGEQLVLFLEERAPGHFIVVGLQQGKMEVRLHPDTGEEIAVRSMVGVDQAMDAKGNMRALDEAQDPAWLPLDTLRNRVR